MCSFFHLGQIFTATVKHPIMSRPIDFVSLQFKLLFSLSVFLLVTSLCFKVVVTAFKTEGFGAIGSLTDVSHNGISDIADDGSICIDSELQVRWLNLGPSFHDNLGPK